VVYTDRAFCLVSGPSRPVQTGSRYTSSIRRSPPTGG